MKKPAILLCAVMACCMIIPFAACGDGEPNDTHTEHTYAKVWSKDGEYHWHEALCCETEEVADKAKHNYDENHECTVCHYRNTNLGTVSVGDIIAWTDIGGQFGVTFQDPSKAEALRYSYDESKINVDGEKQTVTVLKGYTGTVRVTVYSENHATTTFNVTCKQPKSGEIKYMEYARMLGNGVLVDDSGNDTGSKITVGENTTVFIGDSFFDRRWFWTDFYTEDFKGKDAFLAGISEATTADWEAYMEEVFKIFGDKAPKNIAVHLGTNDIGTGSMAAETAAGLQRTLTLLHKKFPETKIYYFGITHRFDNSSHNTAIDSANAVTKAWCAQQDFVTYINTTDLISKDMLNANHGGSYIHPLITTYTVFTEQLEKAGCVIADV